MDQSVKTLKSTRDKSSMHYAMSTQMASLRVLTASSRRLRTLRTAIRIGTISLIVYSWNGFGSELRAERQQHNKST